MLLLLEKDDENAIENYPEFYEERMAVLESYKEQEVINYKMNSNISPKVKIKKF